MRAQQPLAESYVEAQEFGRRDEKDPVTVDYHRNTLLPQFSARYRAHLRDCQATLAQPDQTPFSFVAALDSEGKVLRLWSDRSPPVYSCVRGQDCCSNAFRRRRARRFIVYIHMRFAN